MIMERDRRKGSLIIADFPLKETCLSLEDDLLKQRLARVREMEALGCRAYGRRYEFSHTIPGILAAYGPKPA